MIIYIVILIYPTKYSSASTNGRLSYDLQIPVPNLWIRKPKKTSLYMVYYFSFISYVFLTVISLFHLHVYIVNRPKSLVPYNCK